MIFEYEPKGTCSKKFTLELDNGRIVSVSAEGGCNGNLSGVCTLVRGMDAKAAADTLRGIPCGTRGTSCPDQLSKAIDAALAAGETEQ